jgi:hypothetical protein
VGGRGGAEAAAVGSDEGLEGDVVQRLVSVGDAIEEPACGVQGGMALTGGKEFALHRVSKVCRAFVRVCVQVACATVTQRTQAVLHVRRGAGWLQVRAASLPSVLDADAANGAGTLGTQLQGACPTRDPPKHAG